MTYRRRVGMRFPKITYAQQVVEATAGVETGVHSEEFEGGVPRKGNSSQNESYSEHCGPGPTHMLERLR